MSNNFRQYTKTKARRIQGHSSTSLQIQGHEFLFSNSRTFKDFQVLNESWVMWLIIVMIVVVALMVVAKVMVMYDDDYDGDDDS
jgi:hypothetical protein